MALEYTSQLIFGGAILALLCVLASVLSRRLGAPILLVFLVLGMLAGEDGPGGIRFNDFNLAFVFGNLALAIILFDGGLGTRKSTFRVSLSPALSLATVGVLITAAITGVAAYWILDLSWLEALLIGAIVGSTDAAAVFGLLRLAGLELKERTGATLEIESGTNDPMAIFLTITLVYLLANSSANPGLSILLEFVQQMGVGLIIGAGGGWLMTLLLRRIHLPASLYPLFALAGGMSVFGLANLLGGSGFLAIYIAGVIVGNTSLPYGNDIHRFHDGMAWLSQIGMFLMLGLLITPSKLLPIIAPAIAIALVLIFVARPLAVAVSLLPFHFPWREQLFVSWCGLRGAVPIILALFPSLAGLERTSTYFELVFFVVLISLVLQGWTIAPVAKWLQVDLPPSLRDPEHLSLKIPDDQDKELLVYQAVAGSDAIGMDSRHLPLEEGAQVVGIVRNGILVDLPQQQKLQAGDHIMMLANASNTHAMGRIFAPKAPTTRLETSVFFGNFVIHPEAQLGDLAMMYGFTLSAKLQTVSIETYIQKMYHGKAVVGDTVQFGRVQFVVKDIDGSRISALGLKLLDQ